MRAPWNTFGLVAIPIAYSVVLVAFVTDALSNGLDDLTVACVLALITAVGVGSWYKIGLGGTSKQGRVAQRLVFASGAWVGAVLLLFAAYAFLHMFYGHPWQFSD